MVGTHYPGNPVFGVGVLAESARMRLMRAPSRAPSALGFVSPQRTRVHTFDLVLTHPRPPPRLLYSCIWTRLCPSRGPFSRDFSLTRPPPQQLRRYYFADGGKKCRDYDTESPANNFLGIRHVDPAGEFGDSLYAEFQTGVQSARFEVDFSKVDFVEYYNLTADLVRKQAQSCQCVTAASLYPAETLLRMQKRTSF